MNDTSKRDRKCRGGRPKKRKFFGNQFKKSQNAEGETSSSKKMKSANLFYTVTSDLEFEIINFFAVFNTIASLVMCKECGESVKFEKCLYRGLGFQIKISCNKCRDRFIHSSTASFAGSNVMYEVNSKLIAVMRCLGIGYSGLKLFCGLMDLPQPVARCTYNVFVKQMRNVAAAIAKLLMTSAITQEIHLSENAESLVVSGDGTWRKRGFQSLHGVPSLIGYYTGKVVDVVIKSSYCAACKLWEPRSGTDEYMDWLENHVDECQANHEGSSGKMEVDAILDMFKRSEDKYGVKYKYYIGDGDSKTFKTILDEKPYGEGFQVIKKECVGHIQKRMGTRLRNVKKNTKGLGGKGKLTDKVIGELSKYYGNAIRNNNENVEKMKKAIMATLYHKCSTDAYPQHQFCPEGADSWCTWQKAKAEKKLNNYKHKPALPDDVFKVILPIYKDLSNEDLLTRCIGGYTQNTNESFNNLIWKIAPKTLFSGTEIVEIATYLSICIFNEGSKLLLFLEHLHMQVGKRAEAACAANNERRLHDAENDIKRRSKESRINRRIAEQQQADADEDLETSYYAAGNF